MVDSDSICMLKNGSITEVGTHHDLLARDGSYAELFREQEELEHFSEIQRKEEKIHEEE